MLVLTRKLGQAIVIGEDIKVEILEVRGGKIVRLGITAPKDVEVHREEIAESIKKYGKHTL